MPWSLARLGANVATALPPIEISSPTDPNKTRARPLDDEGAAHDASGAAAQPRARRHGPPTAQPGDGDAGATSTGVRQFNGIVGTSSTVITAEDIAAFAGANLQEIIAQTPGVQLTSLYGGVNGVKTTVDLRGFGAFATSNTLILINGRRLNDIDMARSISRPFRAIRSSASRSPAATAARCSTATTRSAASSTSS